MALAGREDGHDQELRGTRDRPRADVEPRDRRPEQRAAPGQLLPDRDLVGPEAGEELVDLAGVDVQDDADGLHGSPPRGCQRSRRSAERAASMPDDAVDAATGRASMPSTGRSPEFGVAYGSRIRSDGRVNSCRRSSRPPAMSPPTSFALAASSRGRSGRRRGEDPVPEARREALDLAEDPVRGVDGRAVGDVAVGPDGVPAGRRAGRVERGSSGSAARTADPGRGRRRPRPRRGRSPRACRRGGRSRRRAAPARATGWGRRSRGRA